MSVNYFHDDDMLHVACQFKEMAMSPVNIFAISILSIFLKSPMSSVESMERSTSCR